jgi:hypothetical protein
MAASSVAHVSAAHQNFHLVMWGKKLKIQPLKLPSTTPIFLNLLKAN